MQIAFYSQSSSSKLDIFERWKYSHHIAKDGNCLCGFKRHSFNGDIDNYRYGNFELIDFNEENLKMAKQNTDDRGKGMCKKCLQLLENLK